MSKEFVYIMTNECLDGWVKIGKTNDLKARLQQLNNPSNMPLSFRLYAAYETENAELVEKGIHDLIDTIDNKLRAVELLDGKKRVREFYKLSPEKIYTIFAVVAKLRGESDSLKAYERTKEESEIESFVEEIRHKRHKLTFALIDVPVGAELAFLYDDSVKCVVADSGNQVTYQEQNYSISNLAAQLLIEKCGWRDGTTAQGGKYFLYEKETLTDRRERIA